MRENDSRRKIKMCTLPYSPTDHLSRMHARGVNMEETLCNVEFIKENNNYIARVQSEIGGLREYQSVSLEEVLEQVIIDLQEEFETAG